MYKQIALGVIAVAAIAGAQTFPRHASLVGGGNPNEGKCTIEVVVDGAAEVEIRGADAILRNLSGQAAQWRRFECTSPLPANPVDFRFAGVDGRGNQQLLREPRNGGPAVVRIEDRDGGSEGYTFDVTWGGRNVTQDRGPAGARNDRGFSDDRGVSGQSDRNFGRDRDRPDIDPYHRERETSFRGDNWRATFFQRIQDDLDHVASAAFPSGRDQSRLARTKFELGELQQKLSRGVYDERELDQATAALQSVVQSNRLGARDRDILTDDLARMRDFRMRHD